MSFFKWVRKKEEEPHENEPVLAAVIKNPVTSEIFQDILKENGIPFTLRRKITKQQEDFTRRTCKPR